MEQAKPHITADLGQPMGYHNQQPMYGGQPGYNNPQGMVYQQPVSMQPIIVVGTQQQPQPQVQTKTETFQVDVEGDHVHINCSACGYSGVAHSYLVNGSGVWITMIILFFVYCPLFWLPLVLDNLKDNIFECPKCHREHSRKNVC